MTKNKANTPNPVKQMERSGNPAVRAQAPQAKADARAKKKAPKPNPVKQMERSGNPAVRAQAPKEEAIARGKKKSKELFLRVTGLVVVGVMGATLLVSAIGNI